ncbi:MAG: 50S ribosomal protein L10 [Ruminococcus sp.]|jgi:large subunit ribosomal protein L10|nr:50S ribosomal protein L10 [Ruminococcus sp.]
MASQSILEGKKARVTELANSIKSATAGVIVDYKGINVADDTALRKELRTEGISYFVEKNSILRRAFAEAGLTIPEDVLKGSSALALTNSDQTAPARILGSFSEKPANVKADIFKLKAGFIDADIYDTVGVNKLSKIPSKEVLLSQLVGSLQGPMQKLAATLQALVDKKNEETAA